MANIRLTGHILVPEKDMSSVLEALPRHIELTRAEPGCLVFNVTQDASDPRVFHVYEVFFGSAALEYHQDRVNSSEWGALTQGVERHYKIAKKLRYSE